MKKERKATLGRREFLRTLGAGATVAAAAPRSRAREPPPDPHSNNASLVTGNPKR